MFRSLSRLIAALMFVACASRAVAQAASAAPLEDALQGFTTDDFSDIGDAIEAVAASGDPKAAPVLEALLDGRLLYSADPKKVFIQGKDDRLADAATGAPVETPP